MCRYTGAARASRSIGTNRISHHAQPGRLATAPLYRLRRIVAALLISLMLLSLAVPARAEGQAEPPMGTLSALERSAYKTLSYQAVANLSDLGLFAVILGGSAVTGSSFLVVNAVSAAGLYFPYEYAWTVRPEFRGDDALHACDQNSQLPDPQRGPEFRWGYLFGAGAIGGATFVAANFITDTAIYLTNEAAWDAVRPTGRPPAPAEPRLTEHGGDASPSSRAILLPGASHP